MITPAHRRRLNRAMHELRRPLQALALLEPDDPRHGPARGDDRRGLLELIAAALGELERAVNGDTAPPSRTRFCARDVVVACLGRWRPAAAAAGGFRLLWDAGPAMVEGDPVRMAQAIDNLIANALEHGGPPLILTGARVAGRLRITVANGRAEQAAPPPGRRGAANGSGRNSGGPSDPRHGHGTAIVSEVASEHHGRFALCGTGDGCVAAFELPLADPRYAQAA